MLDRAERVNKVGGGGAGTYPNDGARGYVIQRGPANRFFQFILRHNMSIASVRKRVRIIG
ncbi:hypothetical protein D3C72_1964220 [compost metagenome]